MSGVWLSMHGYVTTVEEGPLPHLLVTTTGDDDEAAIMREVIEGLGMPRGEFTDRLYTRDILVEIDGPKAVLHTPGGSSIAQDVNPGWIAAAQMAGLVLLTVGLLPASNSMDTTGISDYLDRVLPTRQFASAYVSVAKKMVL